jgi:hypothetical protein
MQTTATSATTTTTTESIRDSYKTRTDPSLSIYPAVSAAVAIAVLVVISRTVDADRRALTTPGGRSATLAV